MNERLSASQLAALLAHQINNPLASVANLLLLIRLRSGEDDVKKLAAQAESELERVVSIARGILSQPEGGPPVAAEVDGNGPESGIMVPPSPSE